MSRRCGFFKRYRIRPPSMISVWPVTIGAEKPRYTMLSAISSVLQRRPSGAFSIDAFRCSSVHSTRHVLSTAPGATALTLTCGARATARCRVRKRLPPCSPHRPCSSLWKKALTPKLHLPPSPSTPSKTGRRRASV